jgi:hypothetical protein
MQKRHFNKMATTLKNVRQSQKSTKINKNQQKVVKMSKNVQKDQQLMPLDIFGHFCEPKIFKVQIRKY